MNLATEDDLIFEPTRVMSPQWKVTTCGVPVARVTERLVAQPRYVVMKLDANGADEGEYVPCEDDDQVMEHLLALANPILLRLAGTEAQ